MATVLKLAKNERLMTAIHLALRKIHITAVGPLMAAAGARATPMVSKRVAAMCARVAARAPGNRRRHHGWAAWQSIHTRRTEAQSGLTRREITRSDSPKVPH